MTSSTKTPRFGLPYIDPSQEQPEVKINEAWNIIDANLGDGGSDVSSGGGSDGAAGRDGAQGRRGRDGDRGHRIIMPVQPALIVPPRPQVVVARRPVYVRRARHIPPGMPLSNSGVSAGTYTLATVVVASDGRVTFAASGGAGGAGVPGTIPDLVMWWESDDINVSAGKPVWRLRDRTPWGGGILAANNTPGQAPGLLSATQLNSLNTVTWATTASGAVYPVTNPIPLAPTINPAATFFVVANGATSTGAQAFLGGVTGGSSLSFYLTETSGTAKIGLTKTGVAAIGTATNAWTPGTWFQANATYNGTTGDFAFRQSRAANGSGTGATGAGATSACTEIGSDSSSTNFLDGAGMAALIVYNRVLSPTQITNVENYLFAKWGV